MGAGGGGPYPWLNWQGLPSGSSACCWYPPMTHIPDHRVNFRVQAPASAHAGVLHTPRSSSVMRWKYSCSSLDRTCLTAGTTLHEAAADMLSVRPTWVGRVSLARRASTAGRLKHAQSQQAKQRHISSDFGP
eukprot:scaffold293_cov267-Prasinococcus_capsulatus_cf.AAC.10